MNKKFNFAVLVVAVLTGIETGVTTEKPLSCQENKIMEGTDLHKKDVDTNVPRYIEQDPSATKYPLLAGESKSVNDASETSELIKLLFSPSHIKNEKTDEENKSFINNKTHLQGLRQPTFTKTPKLTTNIQEEEIGKAHIQNEQNMASNFKLNFNEKENSIKSAFSPKRQIDKIFNHTEKGLFTDIIHNSPEIGHIENDFQLSDKKNRKIKILISDNSQNESIDRKSIKVGRNLLKKKRTKKVAVKVTNRPKLSKAKIRERQNAIRGIAYKVDRAVECNGKILSKLNEISWSINNIPNNLFEINSQNQGIDFQSKQKPINSQSFQFRWNTNFIQDDFDKLPTNKDRIKYLFNHTLSEHFKKWLLKASRFVLYDDASHIALFHKQGKEHIRTILEATRYIENFFKPRPYSIFKQHKEKKLASSDKRFEDFWVTILSLNVLSKDNIAYINDSNKVENINTTTIQNNISGKNGLIKIAIENDLVNNIVDAVYAIRSIIEIIKHSSTSDAVAIDNIRYRAMLEEVKEFVRFSYVMYKNEFITSIPVNISYSEEYKSVKTVKDLFENKFLPLMHEYFKLKVGVRRAIELELRVNVPDEILNYSPNVETDE